MTKLTILLALSLFGCGKPSSPTVTSTTVSTPVPVTSEVTSASVSLIPVSVLGKYETNFKFKNDYLDRAHNIQLVANLLNNREIPAGAEFSFNRSIGPRTSARGFRLAPTIFQGEILKDEGGGTCQVSSTLFAAALDARLEVVYRRPHSRVPKYILKGLDATVAYPPDCDPTKSEDTGCVDLKLRNPFSYPVTLTACITTSSVDSDESTLSVQISGMSLPSPPIDSRWVTYRTPMFDRRVLVMPFLLGGKKRLRQVGQNGVEGALLVNEETSSGQPRSFRIISNYKPVDEIWEVGPDWGQSKTPWD